MTKVLIIEDNVTVTNLYRNLLRAAGFAVEAASDGAKGLAAVSSFRPDVVLLDLMLPAVDGMAILRTLRADPEWAALPIVVFFELLLGRTVERGVGSRCDPGPREGQQHAEAGRGRRACDGRGADISRCQSIMTNQSDVDRALEDDTPNQR
jgi:hypothetical protein